MKVIRILSASAALLISVGCQSRPSSGIDGFKAVSAAFNYFLREWPSHRPHPVIISIVASPFAWQEIADAFPSKSDRVSFVDGKLHSPAKTEIVVVRLLEIRAHSAVVSLSWIAGSTGAEGHVYYLRKSVGEWAVIDEVRPVSAAAWTPQKPNKALEPTTTSVTSPAVAGDAPAVVVAHL